MDAKRQAPAKKKQPVSTLSENGGSAFQSPARIALQTQEQKAVEKNRNMDSQPRQNQNPANVSKEHNNGNYDEESVAPSKKKKVNMTGSVDEEGTNESAVSASTVVAKSADKKPQNARAIKEDVKGPNINPTSLKSAKPNKIKKEETSGNESARHSTLVNTSINTYWLEKILGTGDFGTVYKGNMQDFDYAAVKVSETSRVAEIEKEILEGLGKLDCIPKFKFWKRSNDNFDYLGMELGYDSLRGASIKTFQLLMDGQIGPQKFSGQVTNAHLLFRPSTIQAITFQAVEALEKMHSLNIIHRDIKLGNMLLSMPDNHKRVRILLTDFGLAYNTEEENDDDVYVTENVNFSKLEHATPDAIDGKRNTAIDDIIQLSYVIHLHCRDDSRSLMGFSPEVKEKKVALLRHPESQLKTENLPVVGFFKAIGQMWEAGSIDYTALKNTTKEFSTDTEPSAALTLSENNGVLYLQ